MATMVPSPYGPIDIETGEAISMNGVTILNPAIKGSYKENPSIILGIEADRALVVDVDGKLNWVPIKDVQLDWRYDFKAEGWVDATGETLEAAE